MLTTLVLGEALMDCLTQPDGTLLPLMGGSPFNLARAVARQGAPAGYLSPFSGDSFGRHLRAQAEADGVRVLQPASALPTALAVVTLGADGQPSYGFYREGVADRDWQPEALLAQLRALPVGVLHTGSLMLVPPESDKALAVMRGARALGWTVSLDVNLRPRLAGDPGAYRAAVMQAVALADWVKASDEDLHFLGFEDASPATAAAVRARFAAPANRRIALTFGGQGARLWVEGREAAAPAPAVAVADTVGAGDTFWGSCLADWAEGGDAAARVDATLHRALTAAALNCTRKGCQPPTLGELRAALA